MVKVCSFSFFEEQRILTPKTGEPLAIACSDQYLFVAEEGCVLEVYPLTSTEPIAQLRTVSPVVQLMYNAVGDCIVTVERKTGASRMFGRVYFKWRQSTIDRPMRITLISSLTQGLLSGSQTPSAEIVELPADDTSVSCIAVCTDSGRVAMGMDTKVRVFSLSPEYESGHVTSHNIEILLDVETSVCICRVAVFGDYLAFISASEARVLKISLLNEAPPTLVGGGLDSEASSTTAGFESDQATPNRPHPPKVQLIDRAKETTIQTDSSFVSWSPSKVWEEERLSANSSLAASINQSHDSEPHPLYNRVRQAHCANVETLALPTITMATQERTVDHHPMEVLGPVEYIWGQPVEVRMEEATPTTKCRVLTMLYRRFSASQTMMEGLMRKGATASLPVKSRRGQEQDETGLHTIELVPVKLEDSQTVIGVSCFIGSRLHGYLYDVAGGCGLISSFSFMSDTVGVASDGHLFHALSHGSVETYSNRAMQAALYNRPSIDSEHAKWLKQPCPRPNMDLTLMSSNMLIGGCCLATSQDYLVVLTKSGESQPSTGNWLLQSLRRPAVEPTWNIYILLKKDPLQLYHQFVEYGEAHKGTSPSMYQHMLSEGHVLLRNQLLQNSSLSASVRTELDRVLCDNCFSLADSLCPESRGPDKIVVSLTAKYFMLSGTTIAKVVQHITSKYPQTKGLPCQVLLKYLTLVLTGGEVRGQLEPIAHTVLDLFAEHKPKHLPHVILTSSLGQLAPDHGLTLLTGHLQGVQKSYDLFKGQLCQVLLLLRLDRCDEACDLVRQIPEDFLTDWLKDNMAVVMDTSSVQLTTLGKLLWSQREGCLLELIHHSFVSGHTTLDQSMAIIKDCEGGLANNTLLKGLLERLVLNMEQETFRLPAAVHLVDLLLARLISISTPRQPPSTPFSLYGNRHKWLDALPPFDGSTQSQLSQTVLQDLMELQALLCSTELLPIQQVAEHAHSRLEGCGQEVVGGVSLKLLTWPHIGKIREAILLALRETPQVTVELCLTFLPSDLGSWRDLLTLLMDQVLTQPHSSTHQSLYRGALDHVVTMTTPTEFLALLPPTGTVKFFLPFIESSLRQYIARQLAGQLNHVT